MKESEDTVTARKQRKRKRHTYRHRQQQQQQPKHQNNIHDNNSNTGGSGSTIAIAITIHHHKVQQPATVCTELGGLWYDNEDTHCRGYLVVSDPLVVDLRGLHRCDSLSMSIVVGSIDNRVVWLVFLFELLRFFFCHDCCNHRERGSCYMNVLYSSRVCVCVYVGVSLTAFSSAMTAVTENEWAITIKIWRGFLLSHDCCNQQEQESCYMNVCTDFLLCHDRCNDQGRVG